MSMEGRPLATTAPRQALPLLHCVFLKSIPQSWRRAIPKAEL